MSRELLLLRHGKSDWDTGVKDFDRPLKKRGRRAAQRMGQHLLGAELVPDYLLTSPAERARGTARHCARVMGLTPDDLHDDPRIYESSTETLCQVLADCPASARRLMLVGHNPGLENLLQWLVGDDLTAPEDGKLMPTATLARLAMPDAWSRLRSGCASLIEQVRPCELPETFPFPGPDGVEWRDRPAYYYNQSAVIPYRWVGNELQILLITSSSKLHWVVPKGILEPGMTPWHSAAKEALEEAGVDGEVSSQPLGSYDYEKWGATCVVNVYPLAVKSLVSDEAWEGESRQCRWLPAQEASVYLKQRELGQMVQQLAQQLGG